jgi:ribonuclease PH
MLDFETLSPFRSDGRKPNEMRDLEFEVGLQAFKNFNGSARIKQGLSEVIVFVDGPKSVHSKARKPRIRLERYRGGLQFDPIR